MTGNDMAKNKSTRGRATLGNSPVAPGASTTSEEVALATASDRGGHDAYEPTYDDIAQAAYHRYEGRGRNDGQDLDDWIEAERELRARKRPAER
jgi:hypothetical protein